VALSDGKKDHMWVKGGSGADPRRTPTEANIYDFKGRGGETGLGALSIK